MSKRVYIIGLGSAFPRSITNESLVEITSIGVPSEWLKQKIGIDHRYCCRRLPTVVYYGPDKGEECSDLSSRAAVNALEVAAIDRSEVDMIILSSCTPDSPLPPTSAIVQTKLGIPKCAVLDIRSACCGSTEGIITACQYLKSGYYKTILVIGTENGSAFGNLDHSSKVFTRADRVNATMIGDGSGALVLRSYDESETDVIGIEILYTNMNCIGMGKKPGMYLPAGGSSIPLGQDVLDQGLQHFKHDPVAVMEHGGELFGSALEHIFNDLQVNLEDIAVFIPHQANSRIPDYAPSAGIPRERLFYNFDRVGNCANASLPLCLEELLDEDKVPEEGLVLMVAAESTKWIYASVMMKWRSLWRRQQVKQGKEEVPPSGKKLASRL